jgi:hypothetical protein
MHNPNIYVHLQNKKNRLQNNLLITFSMIFILFEFRSFFLLNTILTQASYKIKTNSVILNQN